MTTLTENGETAYSSSGNKCLDLFAMINRDVHQTETLYRTFINAWNENPETCIKIMFNFRDIREGKGEKRISYIMMQIIKNQKTEIYKKILESFINFGYYKDLLQLSKLSDANCNSIEVDFFADQLRKDVVSETPSLCAKWAPSESSTFNKKPLYMANNIQKKMSLTPKEYRKLLTGLRNKIHIVENDLSQKTYENINFEHIPSKAHLNYKDALARTTNAKKQESEARQSLSVRYNEYLKKLANGEQKVNFKGLMPHEIISAIKQFNSGYNALIENQWKALSEDTKKLGIFNRCVSVVDVSGSMMGSYGKCPSPIDVAVALGILISECSEGRFKDKVVTFSQKPEFVNLSNMNLHTKISKVSNSSWGMNTDIEAVFNKILETGTFYGLSSEQMPERLFIFTDMQFDQVSGQGKTFHKISQKFIDEGYNLPQIVCWNLRTAGSIPCEMHDEGVVMLSGFSVGLLKSVMSNKEMNFTPKTILNNLIESYNVPEGLEYGKLVVNIEELCKIKNKLS
jgi:hypothetical protein